MEMEYLSNLACGVGAVVLVVTEGCRGAVTLVTLSPSRTSLSTSLSFFFSFSALPPPALCGWLHHTERNSDYNCQLQWTLLQWNLSN